MVSVLGPLFRTAGHTVRTQHGVTASAGQWRGDVELFRCGGGRVPSSWQIGGARRMERQHHTHLPA
jgi:hypothetical protein